MSSVSRNVLASATASAAWAVEYAFVARRAPGLSGVESEVSERSVGEVGVLCEIGFPDGPERSHLRLRAVVQRRDDALRELGTHALVAGDEPVREPQQRCAHDVTGAGGPSPTRCPAIAERLKAAASSAATRASLRMPTPVVNP